MAVAAEGVGGAFGYLGGLAEGAAALAPTAGEVAGTLAGVAGVGAAATAGLAVGIAGGAAYGLARGTGWVLENTLFRPQQGSEDAAVQDVRSANNMNDATQPQHFTLRTGSSTSGSPASSRASSQSGFRVQAQSNNTPRPFSWGLNPVALPQSQPSSWASSSSGRRSLPPPCCSCAHKVRCSLRSVGRAAQTARDGGLRRSVLRLLRLHLLFGRLHLIIRGQDTTRTTKTTRKAGRRCRPGLSGGSACASG